MEKKPIIVIAAKKQELEVEGMLTPVQLTKFKKGVTQEVLMEIRGWKTGILLINPEEALVLTQDSHLIPLYWFWPM